ncbi:DUF6443 domain-containing protein [Chitinophaga pinensis]|uniref:DUF6443 domain-containing protein n=1 Tax=Chitinophaga pinensis (strain ATCC 43595 / DSM 2588 / LMG 13176 / NBRC 15968 / NCIMB 11800 / UQM 2034) TaxID=485918 RepID=A0A979G721_CHIPD|nr:DUF6443 domain-containing protein [Chitinophaga pinensis]ACU61832.1 hypothetical protein Cpin_4386 [Chitinophaga pinensis DSM 2588]
MRTYQFIILLLVLGTGQRAVAQNVPLTPTPYTPVTLPVPPAYQCNTISYIRSWQPNIPITDPAVVKSPFTASRYVRQTTEYLDGLGRRLQLVEKQKSPAGKDLVTPVLYEADGRAHFQYLPYVPQTGNTNDGSFKSDPFQDQQAFYQDAALNPGINNESYFFHETTYEQSPLGREEKTYRPGNAYAKEAGNKPAQQLYQLNTESDSVLIWRFNGTDILPFTSQRYAPGTLHKKTTMDENGTQQVVYTDIEGHVVLRKQQAIELPGTAHYGWACTYYTYDNMGRLRVVLSPKAVQAIQSDWIITNAIADELCIIYRYDGRGRKVIVKEPGIDSLERIYDLRNRLTMSRSAVLKSRNMWQLYYYDDTRRRLRSTGLIVNTASRDSLLKRINASPYDSTKPYPGVDTTKEYSMITKDQYDDYLFVDNVFYSGIEPLKVEGGSNIYFEPPPPYHTNLPHRLLTIKTLTIPGLKRLLLNRYFYNNSGRLSQTVFDNVRYGLDITSYMYDLEGKLVCTYLTQTKTNSLTAPAAQLLTIYHYDAAGRLDSITKKYNDNPALRLSVAEMEYDELGRMKTKKLYASGNSTPVETQTFTYDLRGQLTGINKPFVNTPNSTDNWFGQEISYETGFANSYYNGNVAGIKWKSGADGMPRAYGYSYDRMDRLLAGDFNQQNEGSSNWTADKADFSLNRLTYDINGNILSMKQRGMNGMAIQTIDSLEYGYLDNSNRLSHITDRTNNPQTILGDFRESVNDDSKDYSYDPGGNLAKDNNKDIDSIIYDQNNKPSVIFCKKGMIYFQFNSEGELLTKIILDTSAQQGSARVIQYANGFVWERDTIRVMTHADGRIRPVYKTGQPVQYVFEAFVKDYQGNVRALLGANRDTADYFASMETARSGVENVLFSNIDNTTAPLPTGYPTDNTTDPNDYVAKLNGVDGAKIGPSLVLRVMKGDTISAVAKAFYKSTTANTSSNTAASMLSALLQAFSSGGVSQGPHMSGGPNSPLATSFSSTDYQQLLNQEPAQNEPTWPKAYLSFVLFDDQFKVVQGNSGVRQVQGAPDAQVNVVMPQMIAEKSGFLYLYLSNESAADVYFDNFVIRHLPGALLEDTHYYPMGLLMEGISSKALRGTSYLDNRYRYKSNELHNREMRVGPGLDWYNDNNRMYDVQTGRWISVQPFTGSSLNPYQYLWE